ncbi:MAG: adenylate kinase [Acidimicrobiaceae bacterium]
MIPGVRLVILGRQGAGKGTQCTRLARHYVVPHISTGDMLRAARNQGTDFGKKADEYMRAGELLPDDVIIGIVGERLDRDDTRKRGYILDGFPRTVGQARALADLTAELPLDVAIDLEAPEDVVLARISNRRVCVDCGTNFSVQSPPRYDWTCDVCGGEVVQRDDDTPEAVRKRLNLYNQETEPLIAWYLGHDLLTTVDGLGSADEVTVRLVRAIDNRTGRGAILP